MTITTATAVMGMVEEDFKLEDTVFGGTVV